MDTEENLTAVVHGINDLRLEITPIPEINDDEVLLRMANVGICGTDISVLTKGKFGKYVLKAPMITGHEASGVVFKCGAAVKNLKKGDRVCIEPLVPCRKCEFCKIGRYNLCPDVKLCSLPPMPGNLARYYKHAADYCYKLPDNLSLEEGAIIEPLSVGVHACRKAKVQLGSRVLICGSGPIGLVNLLTAKAMGATKICMTDIRDDKLKVAKDLGADVTLNVKCGGSAEDIARRVIDLMDGEMPNITLECTGAESSIRTGVFATKSGGKMVIVGTGPADVSFPMVNASIREVNIEGIFAYPNCYPLALEMVASGKVNVKPLITHRYKIEEARRAFETARTGEGGAIKVMISC